MLIDTHCHIDQFPSPEELVQECERSDLRVVAVTNLPSHYMIAADRLKNHKFVFAALGMHPLLASKGIREMTAFKRMAKYANFIGEIGLDCSHQGVPSLSIQERVFKAVLDAIQDRPRFITLHSRGAEAAVLELLKCYGIKSAVFHWFTGSGKNLENVFAEGHYVSINPAMISSTSGQRLIARSPKDRILIESDGPFTSINGKICKPISVALVYQELAVRWKISVENVAVQIKSNFESIMSKCETQ